MYTCFRGKCRAGKLLGLIVLVLLCSYIQPFFSYAAPDYDAEAEARKYDAVQSNSVPGWPSGPGIGAQGAILMEANTGAVLYAKNIHEELYPASITKLMCALVAVENAPLDTMMTVSRTAVYSNAADGASMYLKEGEVLSLENLLYGVLIKSANEACSVIAENIAGSSDAYVEMMNQRSKELGWLHTHFVTPNGLHDPDHYTSAYDMALIARAFFSHEILSKMSCMSNYTIEATDTNETHSLHSKNKLLAGTTYAYDGLVGSKTGYTDDSRQTLVSCAERGGMKLICVILKEESPYQFTDTVALFNYGFNNFKMVNVAQNETGYATDSMDFFNNESGLFGSTSALLSIDDKAAVVLPNDVEFSSLKSSISYEGLEGDAVAKIVYEYEGVPVGSASVRLAQGAAPEFQFTRQGLAGIPAENTGNGTEKNEKFYVNIYYLIFGIIAAVVVIVLVVLIITLIKRRYSFGKRPRRYGKNRKPVHGEAYGGRRNYRTISPSTPSGNREKTVGNRYMSEISRNMERDPADDPRRRVMETMGDEDFTEESRTTGWSRERERKADLAMERALNRQRSSVNGFASDIRRGTVANTGPLPKFERRISTGTDRGAEDPYGFGRPYEEDRGGSTLLQKSQKRRPQQAARRPHKKLHLKDTE